MANGEDMEFIAKILMTMGFFFVILGLAMALRNKEYDNALLAFLVLVAGALYFF